MHVVKPTGALALLLALFMAHSPLIQAVPADSTQRSIRKYQYCDCKVTCDIGHRLDTEQKNQALCYNLTDKIIKPSVDPQVWRVDWSTEMVTVKIGDSWHHEHACIIFGLAVTNGGFSKSKTRKGMTATFKATNCK